MTTDGLPKAFLERLHRIVPADRLPGVLASFSEPPVTAFRINTLRAQPGDVRAELEAAGLRLHDVPWMPEAHFVEPEERAALLESKAYLEQRIYIQNLSSMVPPLLLDPQPGERILDLAAAPGSKTLQMACMMQNEGEIAAVELVKSRFFRLRDNLKAQGATNVRTFLRNGETVWRHRPEHFDRVLLDAPCSTEGRFRTDDPASYAYWSPRKTGEMVRKQRRLMFSAVQSLAVDGVLVYATCAFAPEENEGILQFVLDKFGDAVAIEPVDLPVPNRVEGLAGWDGRDYPPDVRHAVRILPDRLMEGFFAASLRKLASTID
jgi:NOL1/NOP2/sun family putative RNA methylase